MSEIHVTGLVELNKFLQEFPVKVERNILRGALRAGVKPIKAAAVSKCPVGEPSAEGKRLYGLHAGSLRDSIRVTTRSKRGMVIAVVKAGGKSKKGGDVWYAHIIEFTGARAHTIKAAFGRALSFGGTFTASVQHPGMKAKPFMRPALDSQATNAVIAAAEYMKKRIATKEGLDTSGVVIEGDT